MRLFASLLLAPLTVGTAVAIVDLGGLEHGLASRMALAQETTSQNPFERRGPDLRDDAPSAEDPFVTIEPDRFPPAETATVGRCGPDSSLARAGLRKPEMAVAICAQDFSALDDEWLYIIYYVKGFNDFLEERGSFMDPTSACSRAAAPGRVIGLVREAANYLLGLSETTTNPRLEQMLAPFKEDWMRVPLIFMELNQWEREGRLDATSIASLGMCGDPEFQHFWSRAVAYAQRIPGTTQ